MKDGDRRLALVTGVAGFVGSTLAERLIGDGWSVRGFDAFTPYYDAARKRRNLEQLSLQEDFSLVEGDLRTTDLDTLLDGVTHVFHQAAQPGVRDSWDDFDIYVQHNVVATHRLLTAATRHPIERLVYASSSSVYGEQIGDRSSESDRCQPHSPYGVTKLAAEQLVTAFARNFGTPTASLRYFTVYGPRQRPDMAFDRIIRAALGGEPFTLFGTGGQIRDFTYVDDAVDANVRVATAPHLPPGAVYNVCGGSQSSMHDVLTALEDIIGPIPVTRAGSVAGDVTRTAGDHSALSDATGWQPTVGLHEGLERHVAWVRSDLAGL